MRATNRKEVVLITCFVLFVLLPGCTGYQRKYDALNIEHHNLQGRYENLQAERDQCMQQIAQGQQTIEELLRQIDELNQSPAAATGFGEGYDVSFDPSAGTVTVTLSDAILFDSGKAVLKKATSTELDHILSVLQEKYPSKQVDIVGHTDSDPIKKSPWKDNWELSAQRALSVVRYLLTRGIAKDKIRAVGCGASLPIASNATAAGKAKNRRVEVVVYVRG